MCIFQRHIYRHILLHININIHIKIHISMYSHTHDRILQSPVHICLNMGKDMQHIHMSHVFGAANETASGPT